MEGAVDGMRDASSSAVGDMPFHFEMLVVGDRRKSDKTKQDRTRLKRKREQEQDRSEMIW